MAFFLNFGFAVFELAGGFLSNSVAIISDALHDLGDSLAILLAMFLEKISVRKRDDNYSYGYKRFSLLSAVISSLIVAAGSLLIIYEAVQRVFNPEETNSAIMFLMAVAGIVINYMGYRRLESSERNQRAIKLHLLEDILGWVSVLVASVVIYFTNLTVIDPAISIAIALFILYKAILNIKEFVKIFLQAVPEDVESSSVLDEVRKIEGIRSVHDFHLWTMDGNYNVLTLHVVIERETDPEHIIRIRKQIREISRKYKIDHETIEIGYCNEECEFVDC
ncbi:MAG: cation diffusion facilitator family transporter [Ignavibacteriaceae bacterium]|nr:cation diffusion facilitator family transporter [Ignavibacteriaceae bacterium]